MQDVFERIDGSAVNLSATVYERVGAAILDGRLPEGSRLRDVDIARALEVSRTPVREALQRLARIGLVEVVASRFTRVTSTTPEMVEQTLEYTGYQAGLAMRMALERMADAELAHALELIDAMIVASHADDAVGLYAASRALYRHVTPRTGNTLFSAMMREAGLAMERNLRGSRPVFGSRDERDRAYRILRDAVARRDGDAAERSVREQHGIGAAMQLEADA